MHRKITSSLTQVLLAGEPQGQHLDALSGEPQVVVDKGHAVSDIGVVTRGDGGAVDTTPSADPTYTPRHHVAWGRDPTALCGAASSTAAGCTSPSGAGWGRAAAWQAASSQPSEGEGARTRTGPPGGDNHRLASHAAAGDAASASKEVLLVAAAGNTVQIQT